MKLFPLFVAPFLVASDPVASVLRFSPYPGYTGPLTILGSVTISNSASPTTAYDFRGDFTGGEANAQHGLHIHAGVSCAAAGGHFWAPFDGPDPWASVSLTSDAAGAIAAQTTVDFGYTSQHFIGHAMVLHSSDGTRVACGIISDTTNNDDIPSYESVVLGTYPAYSGPLNANGTIQVWDLDSVNQVVNFQLVGLAPNTTGGVHIHVGKTCGTSGAHYWTPANETDPWLTKKYTSNALGKADGSFIVASGYFLADNIHHAVVVHAADINSTRVACGTLGGLLVGSVSGFAPYPGYSGVLNNVTGSVDISYEPTHLDNTYRFDVDLANGESTANMSFHIHAGVTCDNAASVGGHFWAPFTDVDPWNTPKLLSDAAGNVESRFDLSFGYTQEQFVGHAVVIHNSAGTRVACGLITDPTTNAPPLYQKLDLSLYPGYNGTLNFTGKIQVRDLDATRQVVNFLLANLAPNTTGGVHIHQGLSCATSGDHYWTPLTNPDPWANTTYTSNAVGVAEGSFIVSSGYLLAQNIYHAVVVHDTNKVRVACGLLGGSFNVTCPAASIEAAFSNCKAYDFTGTASCSAGCSASLQTLIASFKAQNATVTSAATCLDEVNSTKPWINGALSILKERINFDGAALCNVTTPGVSGATAVVSSVVVIAIPFFLLL